MKYIYYTQETVKAIAEKVAETISVRTYADGSSSDTRRPTTEEERKEIFATVYGALLNLNRQIYGIGKNYGNHEDGRIRIMMQDARDNAEWIIDELITLEDGAEINGYDTVYCPVWAMTEYLWGEDKSNMGERYAQAYGIKREDLTERARV